MKAQHTPGPWQYAQEGVAAFGIVKPDGHSVVHLSALRNSTAHAELEANARLIAAAPDMASALRAILFQLTQGEKVFTRDDCITQARAAYAKATGGAV